MVLGVNRESEQSTLHEVTKEVEVTSGIAGEDRVPVRLQTSLVLPPLELSRQHTEGMLKPLKHNPVLFRHCSQKIHPPCYGRQRNGPFLKGGDFTRLAAVGGL